MMRGPALYPTATELFIAANRSTRIRSDHTANQWTKALARLQRRYPNKRVNEFTEDNLVAFFTLGDDGKPRCWAPNTILANRCAVATFFRWAVRQRQTGWPTANPAADLNELVSTRAVGVKQHNWLSAEQVHAVLAACDDSPKGQRDRVVLMLAVFTGLRASEMAALRWDQVDLHERSIQLIGKGGKAAVVGIPPQLKELLTKWRWEYGAGLGQPIASEPVLCALSREATDVTFTRGIVLFVWGRGISSKAIHSIVQGRGRQIGIQMLAPHDLRRTFAGMMTRSDERGVPMFDLLKVSKMMRHSNVATTQLYLKQDPRSNIEDASRLII